MRTIAQTLIVGALSMTLGWAQPAVAAQAQPVINQQAETAALGERLTIKSAILDEEREILVRLPAGYVDDESARYPLVVVLDGDSHFGHGTLGAGLLEENGRMPESIIVAIPNRHGMRGRDLARAKDNFRRFIGEEVLPFIQATYRTNGIETLFGHSLAGYFTLSVLADHSDMFDSYIAASPVVQVRGSELLGKFDALFKAGASLDKSVYLTMTEAAEEGARATDALKQLVALFETSAPGGLNWRYDFIPGQVHMTTPFPTLYAGLSHAYSDFQAPSFESVEAFEGQGGLASLEAHFAARAAKYGGAASVPEESLRQLGYLFLGEGDHAGAVALLERNASDYPETPIAFNGLGDGYDAAGRTKDALEAYKKAVMLAEAQGSPNASFFARQVARMEEKLAQ